MRWSTGRASLWKCRLELTARCDSESRKDPVEVGADRAVRQEEPLAYLPVREALCRKVGDLEFLGGDLIARCRIAAPARLP
jgi:hypothetical protein